jgi:uncharacterized protein YbaP (TraB family)
VSRRALLRGARRWACGLVAVAASTLALADAGHHSLWVVSSPTSRLVLLGSVHMLKPDASALPAEALEAYEHAAALVMEVDLNSVSADGLVASMSTLAALPEGRTLGQELGRELYARVKAQAAADGLDAEVLEHTQPWMVALMLDQLQMARLGYASASGVDEQLAQRAAADHKRIIGLETMDEQLGFFAHLSAAQQLRYLRYTLDEQDHAGEELNQMVAAWRSGDSGALEKLLAEGFRDFPDLYRLLTSERNRRWLATLEPLLNGHQDYLVVVGAMHLVGNEGLVALLRQRGYHVEQH